MTSYERKIKLIMDVALAKFNGEHTQEQFDMELLVARNILAQLGVFP